MGNADSKEAEQQHVVTSVQTDNTTPSSKENSLSGKLPSSSAAAAASIDYTRNNASALQSRDDENTKISDDQIQVNLAMADLMAYLQVVANNSNHLPLTRRDDPELDRMVASLTSEEYARKSAAFCPADIRMIGATFTRYGRVWDLPTSEEYNATDGALEPGRSYGGACCNTMLKVVYDAANGAAGAAQSDAANEALFDDDDDEEEESAFMTTSRSYRSGFSLDMTCQSNVAVTWAELLRQMKAEFKEIGYLQTPKVTTTRKIDLNKPFSLVPEEFDPKQGKKRSLLIGCNYSALGDAELKASHDDIRSMKDYIVNVHNFPESKDLMTVLLDDGQHQAPTFLNIIEAFKKLSEESQPGDAVFVQFAGHGGRVLDAHGDDDAVSYDEVIVPTDYQRAGLIRDTLIFKTLLAPMRLGVTMTILVDCCDNGMVLELPYSWSTKGDKKDAVAKLAMNEDFSFVRFLKVVKTLYESSTFTQLGKTVGSALGPLSSPMDKSESARAKEKDDILESDQVMTDALQRSGSTIFDALARACTSPHHSRREVSPKSTFAEDEKKDELSPHSGETLFERVINCTLIGGNDDEYSDDEDTLKTRTYDYQSYGESFTDPGESFESVTDDDESRRRSSRRSRRRRR